MKRPWAIICLVLALLSSLPISLQAATIYVYTDDNGHLVVVNEKESIPEAYRSKAVRHIISPFIQNKDSADDSHQNNKQDIFSFKKEHGRSLIKVADNDNPSKHLSSEKKLDKDINIAAVKKSEELLNHMKTAWEINLAISNILHKENKLSEPAKHFAFRAAFELNKASEINIEWSRPSKEIEAFSEKLDSFLQEFITFQMSVSNDFAMGNHNMVMATLPSFLEYSRVKLGDLFDFLEKMQNEDSD
ncbi:MAG: DUF4836 family protein [Candidatus Riflebacteria bacterium]|nr:DUF4836 family protein [Candidatus Riflebacteria bacterium]